MTDSPTRDTAATTVRERARSSLGYGVGFLFFLVGEWAERLAERASKIDRRLMDWGDNV